AWELHGAVGPRWVTGTDALDVAVVDQDPLAHRGIAQRVDPGGQVERFHGRSIWADDHPPGCRSFRGAEGSTGEEGKTHSPTVVLTIGIDNHHALPGAEDHLAVLNRKRHGGGGEHRQEVIASMARRPMAMAVSVVPRQ